MELMGLYWDWRGGNGYTGVILGLKWGHWDDTGMTVGLKASASRALQPEHLTPRGLQCSCFAPSAPLLCIAIGMDCIGDLHPVHCNARSLHAVHCNLNSSHSDPCNVCTLHLLHHCCALQWGWIVLEICILCIAMQTHCKPCIAT